MSFSAGPFSLGKIVFTAPSRPLVMQQIEACHNIVGIPQEWTIDMTGQLSPAKRACFWKTKRVFFVTPQVLEKDIHSGKCLVKYLVCLVIDEAHRAMGNYSYCEVVRELMAVPVQLRILALTATPGAKRQTVQQVIDNLHISNLEYRNENDPDVISYVHKRKIELIQVAMGQDAVEINQQLLEVIRPIVGRLSTIGVLKNRDYRTLSPCELLEIREKYRQAPPQDLSSVNNGDVEGYFGVLISLYYIHKLLSSHGIRPAHEMLERKLKQGFFAKYVSKNEVLLKARMSMQQNLSHGAPSPKLSKMLEILREHFKANDPQSSRVIIFSNYRESVRDIMDALANIGEPIRATQFIGQSSGKTMKGQSQKVQQAVLQKFRCGAYNVIVATSIGEEGLDIMEVDLVVAFDANVSPLRMIQRMGRTGRKHDGQVVVLACEGTELKGYLRKQAKSKAISKHMRNGGINSFTFHPSPRMIPHVFKPEVQFVELSIEKFVSREKKVRGDSIQIHASIGKLTAAENNILAKYFPTTGENTWKPSLVAFPYFQTYPSRTHKVNHSCRAIMLIDLMQRLQGQTSFLGNSKTSIPQDGPCIEASNASDLNKIREVRSDNKSHSRHTVGSNAVSVSCLKLDPSRLGIQTEDFVDLTAPDNIVGEQRSPNTSCIKKDDLPSSSFIDLDENKEKTCEFEETVPDTPIANTVMSDEGHSNSGTPDHSQFKTSLLLDDVFNNDINESQCSPRLTSLIKSGVVPESPIDERTDFLPGHDGLSRSQLIIRHCKPLVHHQTEQQITSSLGTNEEVVIDNAADVNNVPIDPSNNETQTLLFERKSRAIRRVHVFSSPVVEEAQNLLADITNRSFSEDSPLCGGNVADSVKPAHRFKRLRKADDGRRHRKEKSRKDHGKGRRKSMHNVRVFIDDEAEVSSEADVSNDEDGEDDSSSDSFIDDRMNPTATTQSRASGIDMMAIYRRSLLSQIPVEGGTNVSATFSPDYVSSMTIISENGDSSGSIPRHIQTRQIEQTNQSASKSLQSVEGNQITSEATPSSSFPAENTTQMRSRKRKLSFHRFGFPSANLEQQFALQSNEEPMDACAAKDILCDDHIFDNIDLDELEAQAASLLKQNSDFSAQKQGAHTIPQSHLQNPHLSNPSFDLGI
ncbi:DEAD-box ATP-dependent RNA helicase FANCM-like [Neltuma alba]|uniref:DEAD-box ATP-dependent RNA helicase FANCM-like n=1 Tax=Neltuma alba TaxID=207710 RepID=UPI0010A59413|nr:DEAD-box ATP-dependent RNA helicase FANCM-like [Prosopis alba]